ncbi:MULTISPECIES: TadA family conjugal transfer-associated ATPase [Actinomyces]|uniref:TadA family conjugal transfer-associated ATPase n=1 Tax=Actinomyces respiraculi TaxID=2744574 RepID=A0A7T0LKK1_9ACTO|nr:MULTISPECIES: TadA family conjugal transfer-associated ATPase [Actinomyces]QPL05322.1 TadA family conjugal transfer-associated ATPase [Actinomyces respiraculi]
MSPTDRLDLRAAGAPADTELERVRSALARGTDLATALDTQARPARGADGLAALGERVRADVEGAGPVLQPLLETDGVTDVLVGGGHTWIDRGHGLEPVPAAALPEAQARALAVRLAASAGRRLDDASPVVDATLADGTRLNAVLPPLSDDGTLICLRTRRRRAFTLDELVAVGTVASPLAPVLAALVSERASCLVTGATGTGKTTLLAALLGLVAPTERIVCVEEASELCPDHPHVIHLQERGANVQGVGAVPMTALVRTALRMRPDRIVLGECRGPEVREVLAALNTGHEGGWATLHANSPADVPARLTALGALAGLDEAAVAAQTASALHAVVHLRRLRTGGGDRRVVERIGVLSRDREGRLHCDDALLRRSDGTLHAGPGVQRLAALVPDGVLASGVFPDRVPPDGVLHGGARGARW